MGFIKDRMDKRVHDKLLESLVVETEQGNKVQKPMGMDPLVYETLVKELLRENKINNVPEDLPILKKKFEGIKAGTYTEPTEVTPESPEDSLKRAGIAQPIPMESGFDATKRLESQGTLPAPKQTEYEKDLLGQALANVKATPGYNTGLPDNNPIQKISTEETAPITPVKKLTPQDYMDFTGETPYQAETNEMVVEAQNQVKRNQGESITDMYDPYMTPLQREETMSAQKNQIDAELTGPNNLKVLPANSISYKKALQSLKPGDIVFDEASKSVRKIEAINGNQVTLSVNPVKPPSRTESEALGYAIDKNSADAQFGRDVVSSGVPRSTLDEMKTGMTPIEEDLTQKIPADMTDEEILAAMEESKNFANQNSLQVHPENKELTAKDWVKTHKSDIDAIRNLLANGKENSRWVVDQYAGLQPMYLSRDKESASDKNYQRNKTKDKFNMERTLANDVDNDIKTSVVRLDAMKTANEVLNLAEQSPKKSISGGQLFVLSKLLNQVVEPGLATLEGEAAAMAKTGGWSDLINGIKAKIDVGAEIPASELRKVLEMTKVLKEQADKKIKNTLMRADNMISTYGLTQDNIYSKDILNQYNFGLESSTSSGNTSKTKKAPMSDTDYNNVLSEYNKFDANKKKAFKNGDFTIKNFEFSDLDANQKASFK
jgi:hypothetical protein